MRLISNAVAVLGIVGVSALAFAACSSDNSTTTPAVKDAGGGDSSVTPSAVCDKTPGVYPDPTCDPATCPADAVNGGCVIDQAKCGSTSTCLPMANNTGKTVLDFRLRRLNTVAPTTLVNIQSIVVTKNIDLNAPACGENGVGAFNWLLRLDTTANTLTTGGAPLSADPFGAGYCFYNHTTNGIAIAPVTVPVKKTGDVWSADPATKLNIPIFLNGDPNAIVVLPLSNAKIDNFSVSTDGNCIGAFNEKAFSDKTCEDDPTTCAKWLTHGNIGGFITLEDADKVNVADLSQTLCSILTGKSNPNVDAGVSKPCLRDSSGAIVAKGDFCSTTNQAGGCADSYWLSATFAAAAVTINDGASTPATCRP